MSKTTGTPRARGRLLTVAGVVCLLAVLLAQLVLSSRTWSSTWDEGDHILAGYLSWRGDYGLNPEHPPLVKLLATAPLLPLELQTPELEHGYFKIEAIKAGAEFVGRNGPDRILFRSRMAASVVTLLLALLVFLASREMFGTGAGFVALGLLVFEPNLLAHGALVTTDAGLSCFLFATVYAFYRYVKAPSLGRLVVLGLAVGGVLAVKHSGLMAFGVLALLALFEALRATGGMGAKLRVLGRLAVGLVLVGAIAVGVLWSTYGFRYAARPEGLSMNPPFTSYVGDLRPSEARAILTLARWQVLPESYLYGLADVRKISSEYPAYIFGKTYPRGVWFYFPVVLAIKSTLPFLVLVVAALALVALRAVKGAREVVFLLLPAVLFLAMTMTSGLNLGVRHILPVYVFLTAVAGGAAWALARRRRLWMAALAFLLVFHAASSLRSFPVYFAYANEAWGGPSQVYKYLTDCNTDWGQQLKSVKQYLDRRGVEKCWFAYFAAGAAAVEPYGIPCKLLPTISAIYTQANVEAPAAVDGPVLISASALSGYETGSGPLNPYDQFNRIQPTAVIDHGVFVYDGHFQMQSAAAYLRTMQASFLLMGGLDEMALGLASSAAAVCPDCVREQETLGDALAATKKPQEARRAYEKALTLVETLEPPFQPRWRARIQGKLNGLP